MNEFFSMITISSNTVTASYPPHLLGFRLVADVDESGMTRQEIREYAPGE